MTHANPCLFCDHPLDGRSRKFCTSCLPPLGQWADKRDYMARYNLLWAASGQHCSWGFPASRWPRSDAKHYHRRHLEPVAGPWLRDIPEHGPPKPAAHVMRLVDEAIARYPDLDPNLRTLLRSFRQVPLDARSRISVGVYAPSRGGSDSLCRACQRPFERRQNGNGYSYCPSCVPALTAQWNGTGSAPDFAARPCAQCGVMWTPVFGERGNTCGNASCVKVRPDVPSRYRFKSSALTSCENCDVPCRTPKNGQPLCNRCRFIKRGLARNRAMARRYAAEKAGDDISWRELGERDGWRCHICNRKVQKRAGTAKQPRGATVDHIVPLTDDGLHTWDNVALAHRECNTSRGAGGEVQLRLAG
jgi:hypothetical protein